MTYSHSEVGYRHTVTVVIAATDDRGATTRDSFTHELVAVTTVRFRDLRFIVDHPADCFKDEEFQFLDGEIRFGGAITVTDTYSVSVNRQLATGIEFSSDRSASFTGEEPPELTIGFLASFAGWTNFSEPTHSRSEDGRVVVAGLDPDCKSRFSYSVEYDVR